MRILLLCKSYSIDFKRAFNFGWWLRIMFSENLLPDETELTKIYLNKTCMNFCIGHHLSDTFPIRMM